MLDKRYYYNKAIAISEEDLTYIKSLKIEHNLNKKSLAGVLSHIINYYKKHINNITLYE